MDNIHYVYTHTDDFGEVRYVGCGTGTRAFVVIKRTKLWRKAFPNGPRKIEFIAKNLTKEDGLKLESETIKALLAEGKKLVNIAVLNEDGTTSWIDNDNTTAHITGVRRGANHWAYGKPKSEETRNKISKSKLANPVRYWLGKRRDPELIKKLVASSHTLEARTKQAESMRGRTLSDEHKAKIRASLLTAERPDDFGARISAGKKGKPNGLKGRTLSDAHRMRISKARTGLRHNKETLDKINATKLMTGRKGGKTPRRVVCLDNGVIYDSVKEAAKHNSQCCEKHIQACCTGRRQSTGGLRWKYDG